MNRFWISLAALAAAAAVVPSPARAQLDRLQKKCVTVLHKDGLKVASAHAKRLSACLASAHAAPLDLAACASGEPDASTAVAIAKTQSDAARRCTSKASVPAFGIPFGFDDTIVETVDAHTRGLFLDLLGSAPAAAAQAADKTCQAAALKAAQRLAADYGKAATKCMTSAIKTGATDTDSLLPCLDPALVKGLGKLATGLANGCEDAAIADALPGVCGAESDASLAACVAERVRCHACRQYATIAGMQGECDLADDAVANDSCSFPVPFSGNAFNFSEGTRVENANIWVLEHPEMTAVTDAQGYFQFNDLHEGDEVTLVLEHPDYHPIQNGSIRLGPLGAARITFQSVTWAIYDIFADILNIVPDEINKCQIVTTVTRVGKSLYDPGAHGETGATVQLDPPLPAEHGPVYFTADVLPNPALTMTSPDGGVLYTQVPPGDYLWSAHKGEGIYTRIKSKCRAGLLVNASPPWGLQRH